MIKHFAHTQIGSTISLAYVHLLLIKMNQSFVYSRFVPVSHNTDPERLPQLRRQRQRRRCGRRLSRRRHSHGDSGAVGAGRRRGGRRVRRHFGVWRRGVEPPRGDGAYRRRN